MHLESYFSRRSRNGCLVLLLLLAVTGWAQSNPARITDLEPTVLLVSLDGFRYDYPEKASTPNLQRLIREGVRSEVIPIFPTKTFPNHYSIVTGMYAEHHGVVGNNMYDPEFQAYFRMSLREEVTNGRWWGGEPVWVTAARQGQKSATMFWPGSEAEIKGVRPNYWHPYDEKALPSREARVAEVLRWLDLPRAARPTWIAVYFSDADDAGHSSGPDSAEVAAAIEQLDAALGLLLTGLQERGILDQVNLIVTADHGMAVTSRERVIFLDDYLDLADADILEATPVLMVRSRSDNDEGIYRALRAAKRPMRVYRKEELPERYRLQHRRVPPVVAVADEGWSFTTRKRFQARPNEAAGGNHGYDDRVRSMRGFFVARGPSFRQAARAKPFRNIHLYELMCYLLRIPPAPNDGSLREVRRLIRADLRRDHDQASTPIPFRQIERSSFVLDKVE